MQAIGMECEEQSLLARVAAWPQLLTLDELSQNTLQDVARDHGINFATALLYDRLRRSERHAESISTWSVIDVEAPLPLLPDRLMLAIVPGAFYRESPHTGADGGLLCEEAARLGINSTRIPVGSFGAIEDNARIIREWLADCGEENVVLISLSKGGAEVKRALAQQGAAQSFRNVSAWVNLSGIDEYSPLAEWLMKQRVRSQLIRLWFWWRGYDFNVVREFAQNDSLAWRIPASLRVIHVVGFPLRQHLSSPLARRGHRRLESLGPNDAGGNVLAELVLRPGEILPVWGADHYLRSPQNGPRQLLRRVLHYLHQTSPVPAISSPWSEVPA